MEFIFQTLKIFFLDKNEKLFFIFSLRKFKKKKYKRKNIILVENVNNRIHHIPYLYIINHLINKYKSKVYLYSPNRSFNLRRFFFNFLLKIKKPIFFKIISKLFEANLLSNYSNFIIKKKFSDITNRIETKENLYDFKLFGIHFGDILYDHFLKQHRVPTVDINSIKYKKFINESLENIFFWNTYFKKNKVRSLIVSHATYWNGIPARIAIKKNIPVYVADLNNAFYLTKKMNFPYKKFLNYKKNFQKYSNNEKNLYRNEANKRLELRMSGKIGVDMRYSSKSAWRKSNLKKNVLNNSNKIKILISAHCFFDSPNGLGRNLFVDFYEWIKFLGKVSYLTDYEWFIKTHPDFLPGNMEIIKKLCKYFKNIKILPSNTSHHQIINSGIDFVFTVYGSVGIEYAYNNITVINATNNNPNINYNYNVHPKNVNEYKKIIKNLKKIRIKIDKNEILENYYMNNIKKENNIYFSNTYEFNRKFGGNLHNLKSDFYRYWLKNLSVKKHQEIIKRVSNFIDQKNYSLEL